jgi:hypothetical protein
MTFAEIVERGNKVPFDFLDTAGHEAYEARQKELPTNRIECSDGFSMSVIAGEGTYCAPRPGYGTPEGYAGPYSEVEVGFPSERPEPWAIWVEYAETAEEPTGTVYGWVPVETVQALIDLHGGEK